MKSVNHASRTPLVRLCISLTMLVLTRAIFLYFRYNLICIGFFLIYFFQDPTYEILPSFSCAAPFSNFVQYSLHIFYFFLFPIQLYIFIFHNALKFFLIYLVHFIKLSFPFNRIEWQKVFFTLVTFLPRVMWKELKDSDSLDVTSAWSTLFLGHFWF